MSESAAGSATGDGKVKSPEVVVPELSVFAAKSDASAYAYKLCPTDLLTRYCWPSSYIIRAALLGQVEG